MSDDPRRPPLSVSQWTVLRAALLIGGVLLVAYGLGEADVPQRKSVTWLVLGMLLLLPAIRWEQPPAWLQRRFARPGLRSVARRIPVRLEVAWALLLFSLPLIGSEPRLVRGWGLLLWGAALGAALYGLEVSLPAVRRPTWKPLLAAGGLLLVAWAVRLPYLEQLPPLTGDEASFGRVALEFLHGERTNPFALGWFDFPALFSLLEVPGLWLGGRTAIALRMTSIVAGALSVAALWVAGDTLYDRTTGWLAAILLLGLHVHVHFSRLALNNIWDGFWFTGALVFLWRLRQADRPGDWAGLAVVLGLAQYFYLSSRLLLLWSGFWLLWLSRDGERRKRFARRLPGFLTLLAVLVGPLAYTYLHHPTAVLSPWERVRLPGPLLARLATETRRPAWWVAAQYVARSFGAVVKTPLRFWYQPDAPLLRPLWAGIWLLALLVVLLRQNRDARHWLLLTWLLPALTVAGLTETVPAAQRYVAVLPALVLMVAWGMRWLSVEIGKGSVHGRWLRRAALPIAVALAVGDLVFYYHTYLPQGGRWDANTRVANQVAFHLLSLSPRPGLAFFGDGRMGYDSISSLPFRVPDLRAVNLDAGWTAAEVRAALGEPPYLFVALPEAQAEKERVARRFPGGQWAAWWDWNGQTVLYWFYLYPP